jgi:GST-like protein
MIDLYTWPTPNGHKVHIMLEECELPYNVIAIDIGAGDQFESAFLAFSPNNKMPAMIDPDGPGGKSISIFESGAILQYLAEKKGKFIPSEARKRIEVLEWLMFQMGGIGPMLGQAHHFLQYAPKKIEYAMRRYANEANRLYDVCDRRLRDLEYLAGEYSIADMAVFPWLRSAEKQGVNIDDYENVKRWFDTINARPAVERGLEVLSDRRRPGPMDEKTKEMLFGATQYERR